jgi:uncharacterized protein
MKRLDVDWNGIENMMKRLLSEAKVEKPKYIIAISKGGLIPGVYLANVLNLPMGVIYAKSYKGTKRKKLITREILVSRGYKKKLVWVVDDIYDSGKTSEAVCKMLSPDFENFHFKFFINKANWGKEQKKIWVSFPWERVIK